MGSSLKVRVSLGTLIALGLESGVVSGGVYPTTAYILQYSREGCLAKCRFCTQSSSNSGVRRSFLSRIVWPTIDLDLLVNTLSRKRVFKRICYQTVIKSNFVGEALKAISRLKSIGIPISLCTTPIAISYLKLFKSLGVERLGVGLDATTPRVFKDVLKPYTWDTYIKFISKAVEVFGNRMVTVHLIVGLGGSVRETIKTMEYLYSLGAEVALFAYTPVKGVSLRNCMRPELTVYRLLQVVNYLLKQGISPSKYVVESEGSELKLSRQVVSVVGEEELMRALLTSGCPNCNRPYYNESPKGPIYNYPSMSILRKYWDREVEILNKILA